MLSQVWAEKCRRELQSSKTFLLVIKEGWQAWQRAQTHVGPHTTFAPAQAAAEAARREIASLEAQREKLQVNEWVGGREGGCIEKLRVNCGCLGIGWGMFR